MSQDPSPANTTLKVVVVDDEQPARDLLREMLEDHPDLQIVAECANGFEAVKAVHEHAPDLLLLDIQMPKLDGFEVVDLLDPPLPTIIFITAYDEFALKAFEIHALDYLLKPIEQARLNDALDQFRNRQTPKSMPVESLAQARDSRPLERILVRDGGKIHVVPTHRIDFIEAQDDAVLIMSGELKLKKAQRLGDLEKALDPSLFVRIHRSYLLNIERIERIELYAKDSRVAILRDGSRLPVSRSGYSRLRDWL